MREISNEVKAEADDAIDDISRAMEAISDKYDGRVMIAAAGAVIAGAAGSFVAGSGASVEDAKMTADGFANAFRNTFLAAFRRARETAAEETANELG